MRTGSFWERMGSWFGKGNGEDIALMDPPGGDGAETPYRAETMETEEPDEDRFSRLPARKHGSSIELLEEGFSRLVGLLGTIDTSMVQQIEQQEHLGKNLHNLPQTLEVMGSHTQAQTEALQAISEHVSAQKFQTQHLGEILRTIPQASKAQTETLVRIARQLETNSETTVQMIHSFGKFNTTLEGLNRATDAQVACLEELQNNYALSSRQLHHLMRKQSARMGILGAVGITLVLMIMGLGGAMAYILWP